MGGNPPKDYHYIENYDADGILPTFREFYDLRNDPHELNNLYGGDGDPANDPPTNPPAATLHDQLMRDRACRGSQCPPGPGAPTFADSVPPKLVVTSPDNDIVVNQTVGTRVRRRGTTSGCLECGSRSTAWTSSPRTP